MHFFMVQGYQDYILGKAEGYEISRQVFMDLLGLKPKHCRAVRFGVRFFLETPSGRGSRVPQLT